MRVVGCLFAALAAVPAFAGPSVASLERVAVEHAVPEMRLAAGFALAGHFEVTQTEQELLVLAQEGASDGIRRGAGIALGRAWVGGGKTRVFLLNTVTESASEQVRLAAVPALLEFLVSYNTTALEYLCRRGASGELQYAAGVAYFHNNRGKFNKASLEAICRDEAASSGFRRAAAELLAGHYLFPLATALGRAELEQLALGADNEYLRYAAAYALVNSLVADPLPSLYAKVASFVDGSGLSAEYRWAYGQALGIRWAQGN